MDFRLVDSGWGQELHTAVRAAQSQVRIICPFIKMRTVERLFSHVTPAELQVITRFNLDDFCEGVSDVAALRFLLQNRAQIRGIRNLHAKLYLFGTDTAILTSANLTDAALRKNHELGFVTDDTLIVGQCHKYFDDLWVQAGDDLAESRLAVWEQKLASRLVVGARPSAISGLGDEGVAVPGVSSDSIELPERVAAAGQAFIKFFGHSNDRYDRSVSIFHEVKRSGSHWACSYPKNRRPRQVRDGALMFMGRLVKDPNDTLIYGWALGKEHVPSRDDATAADIALRPWKERWPCYIRVHHAEFLAGTLANGISFFELMDVLGADAFESTRQHAEDGEGNTDPRSAYRRHASVRLTPTATDWLNAKLDAAFARHGKLAPWELEQLDWPDLPTP